MHIFTSVFRMNPRRDHHAPAHGLRGMQACRSLSPVVPETDFDRSRRRKCEFVAAGQACVLCRDKGLQCSFVTSSTPATDSSSENVFLTTIETDAILPLPPRDVCEEVIVLYFDLLHDTSHCLFHRPSLLEDLANGSISRPILYAIVGLAAR